MSFNYTLKSAIKAEVAGELRVWVLDYLAGEGDNPKLAMHIRNHPSATLIFKEALLDTLPRSCGPEKDMLWREAEATWDKRLDKIKASIRAGHQLPPLIATDFWGGIHIADGNHRHGALQSLGIERHWTVFFLIEAKNAEQIKD